MIPIKVARFLLIDKPLKFSTQGTFDVMCVCFFLSSLLTECRLTKMIFSCRPKEKIYGEDCAISAKHVVDSCCANGLEVKDKALGIA